MIPSISRYCNRLLPGSVTILQRLQHSAAAAVQAQPSLAQTAIHEEGESNSVSEAPKFLRSPNSLSEPSISRPRSRRSECSWRMKELIDAKNYSAVFEEFRRYQMHSGSAPDTHIYTKLMRASYLIKDYNFALQTFRAMQTLKLLRPSNTEAYSLYILAVYRKTLNPQDIIEPLKEAESFHGSAVFLSRLLIDVLDSCSMEFAFTTTKENRQFVDQHIIPSILKYRAQIKVDYTKHQNLHAAYDGKFLVALGRLKHDEDVNHVWSEIELVLKDPEERISFENTVKLYAMAIEAFGLCEDIRQCNILYNKQLKPYILCNLSQLQRIQRDQQHQIPTLASSPETPHSVESIQANNSAIVASALSGAELPQDMINSMLSGLASGYTNSPISPLHRQHEDSGADYFIRAAVGNLFLLHAGHRRKLFRWLADLTNFGVPATSEVLIKYLLSFAPLNSETFANFYSYHKNLSAFSSGPTSIVGRGENAVGKSATEEEKELRWRINERFSLQCGFAVQYIKRNNVYPTQDLLKLICHGLTLSVERPKSGEFVDDTHLQQYVVYYYNTMRKLLRFSHVHGANIFDISLYKTILRNLMKWHKYNHALQLLTEMHRFSLFPDSECISIMLHDFPHSFPGEGGQKYFKRIFYRSVEGFLTKYNVPCSSSIIKRFLAIYARYFVPDDCLRIWEAVTVPPSKSFLRLDKDFTVRGQHLAYLLNSLLAGDEGYRRAQKYFFQFTTTDPEKVNQRSTEINPQVVLPASTEQYYLMISAALHHNNIGDCINLFRRLKMSRVERAGVIYRVPGHVLISEKLHTAILGTEQLTEKTQVEYLLDVYKQAVKDRVSYRFLLELLTSNIQEKLQAARNSFIELELAVKELETIDSEELYQSNRNFNIRKPLYLEDEYEDDAPHID
jgi:pentatricopeptide repeat protein